MSNIQYNINERDDGMHDCFRSAQAASRTQSGGNRYWRKTHAMFRTENVGGQQVSKILLPIDGGSFQVQSLRLTRLEINKLPTTKKNSAGSSYGQDPDFSPLFIVRVSAVFFYILALFNSYSPPTLFHQSPTYSLPSPAFHFDTHRDATHTLQFCIY